MSRTWSYLRRSLLGAAVVASLGFGATQAFAVPAVARFQSCPISTSGPYFYGPCEEYCYDQGYDFGYCSEYGSCTCTDFS